MSSVISGLEYERVLDRVAGAVRSVLGSGRVPDQIPVLADADPHAFGLAVATVEGEVHGVGEWRRRFSIQSISKVFTLALVIEKDGEALWTRVGREPSGTPFNSLVQLEYEHGIPRNPFINAGALVVTDRLLSLTGDACGAVERFLRAESATPQGPVGVKSEQRAGYLSTGCFTVTGCHDVVGRPRPFRVVRSWSVARSSLPPGT
jgi:glutaminase